MCEHKSVIDSFSSDSSREPDASDSVVVRGTRGRRRRARYG